MNVVLTRSTVSRPVSTYRRSTTTMRVEQKVSNSAASMSSGPSAPLPGDSLAPTLPAGHQARDARTAQEVPGRADPQAVRVPASAYPSPPVRCGAEGRRLFQVDATSRIDAVTFQTGTILDSVRD